LREEFDLYYNKRKDIRKEQEASKRLVKKDENLNLSNFYLNKELEETNKLIEKVLQKLESIFA
jgi:hypothetical protein